MISIVGDLKKCQVIKNVITFVSKKLSAQCVFSTVKQKDKNSVYIN